MEPETTPNTSPEIAPESSQNEPKKAANASLPAAIVTAAVIIGLAIVFAFGSRNATTTTTRQAAENNDATPTTVAADVATIRSDEYVRGNAAAEVAIIEYSDSDCPYCKQFHATMKSALESYNGKVSWVYRYFPLTSLHPNAYIEAAAISCVAELGGNAEFWKYIDTVIDVTYSADAKGESELIAVAAKQGIDATLLRSCMKSDGTKARIDAGFAEAKKIGARGTPFSIAVNTKTKKQVVIPGAVSADYLKQIIDSLL